MFIFIEILISKKYIISLKQTEKINLKDIFTYVYNIILPNWFNKALTTDIKVVITFCCKKSMI